VSRFDIVGAFVFAVSPQTTQAPPRDVTRVIVLHEPGTKSEASSELSLDLPDG